jgi:hypothetical protein
LESTAPLRPFLPFCPELFFSCRAWRTTHTRVRIKSNTFRGKKQVALTVVLIRRCKIRWWWGGLGAYCFYRKNELQEALELLRGLRWEI